MINLTAEIKAALGQPKKQGTENLYTYSPCCGTSDDKFMVNYEKERWICNHQDSCGQRGNLFSLAKLLNLKLPRMEQSRTNQTEYQQPKKYQAFEISTEPVIIQPKTAIDHNQRLQQLEALFKDDNQLIVCRDANYMELLPKKMIDLEYDTDNYTHFKVNHGGSKADDIKDLRYTLVECDEIADLDKQRQFLEGLNLPIASLVYSGNKSLHAIVKIEADNRKEYNRRVELLHMVCWSAGYPIDKTKDPCRFTRLAGAINNKTGKPQQLISLNIGAESWDEWENKTLPSLETTTNTISTRLVVSQPVISGFSSGFLTHDYNDSGLKAGGLTLLTGRRNQGKTTFARQIMIATAMQELGVYAYMAEGEPEREKGYLERLIANKGELEAFDNGYGRVDYFAKQSAKDRFNKEVAPFIDFYTKPLNLEGHVYQSLMADMIVKAKQGSVLFVIDNMMKLTADYTETFKAQQMIVSKLKEFAVHFQVHIILIAHPKKDGTSISGAMEQENTADTILHFQRLFATPTKDQFKNSNISQIELDKVSAIVTNEKVRDGGTAYTMFMQFDPVRQANIDIVCLSDIYELAEQYQSDGYFSRAMVELY